jgi:O-antigen/teichoic acid export membrane protein
VLTGFAGPSAAIGLFTMPAVWLANVFLVRQPDGYAQLGLFSAAYSLRTMILFLPGLMNNVGMSLLNHQIGDDDAGNYRKVFRTNLILTQSVGVAGGLAVILSGPWLLRAFGKEFTEGYTVLLILVLSALVETYSAAMYQAIQSQGKMWLSFLSINTPWWIVFMASAYFFIPGGLAAGLAWAYAAAWFVHAAMTTLQVRRLGLWRSPHGLP